jgi:hypothetical protein
MAGMKISLDAAMRARDISQPTRAQETAAERADEAQPRTTPAPARPRPHATAPGVEEAAVAPVADADRQGTNTPRGGTARASGAADANGAQLIPSPQPASTPDREPARRRRMRRRPPEFRGEP